ncbi:prolyl oligopeptidase family serine peptidase [Mycobacterium lepromatosis]|uniref:prolyl oligopeptidase family serine peptidase n=1 Tax=Mycobacterium lepromatosis TaxID=480418 RepID=UPI001ED9A01F|nr:prolyl oligopeptidase family serine peptidase [Mycobacterium lepromatosis]
MTTDLVNRGIADVEQFNARGGSTGGLLMGIMRTKYPEKFDTLVSEVPLLDMHYYHRLLTSVY